MAEIASATAKERGLAAEKVAQWALEALDPQFAAILSRTLDSMIALEDSEAALEPRINTVAEISALGLAPADSIARVISARPWEQPHRGAVASSAPEHPFMAPRPRRAGRRVPGVQRPTAPGTGRIHPALNRKPGPVHT